VFFQDLSHQAVDRAARCERQFANHLSGLGGIIVSDQPRAVSPTAVSNYVEFRVLIRGLRLDETTRGLIDAAIRSAVLQELATIDNSEDRLIASPSDDPHTRSLIDLDNTCNHVCEEVCECGWL
jgi:hypothetical protein